MKEIKIVFNDDTRHWPNDSFAVYIDGVQQENVKSIDIHADNLCGDMYRNLTNVVNMSDVATYTIQHYYDLA